MPESSIQLQRGTSQSLSEPHAYSISCIVLVAVNPSKSTLFTMKERLEMIMDAVAALPNVRGAGTHQFVVEFARDHQAKFLVRGLRGMSDIEYETKIANANLKLAPEIATLFIPAQPELSEVSSSRLERVGTIRSLYLAILHKNGFRPAIRAAESGG